jgi:hypothetical protein
VWETGVKVGKIINAEYRLQSAKCRIKPHPFAWLGEEEMRIRWSEI